MSNAIVLTGQDAIDFWHDMIHPNGNDPKRYEFFKELDGDIEVELGENGKIVCHLKSDEKKELYDKWKELINDSTN